MINWFVITPLFVISVMMNSETIECVIIVICLVSIELLLMKSATENTTFQCFSQLYFTICLAIIVTYLLKHREIAKEIFLVYQVMNKSSFLSRSRSLLTNLLMRKEKR